MRVLIATDKFAGTLSAAEAAHAIEAGWRRGDPEADLDLAPVSDGGPGFVEVLNVALGGHLLAVPASGPLGDRVQGGVLRHGDTAYVEIAQACGLHLVAEQHRDPTRTTTYGVGELLAASLGDGARRCVLGLGGSATNDGGAGMLAGLGARPTRTLRRGGLALGQLGEVDLAPARERVAGRELILATDVDNPLLGTNGASSVFGPQKGASPDQVLALDTALEHWASLTGSDAPDAPGAPDAADAADAADAPGAGAAGGLGFGLYLLGARRESGIEAVLRSIRLDERARDADLVLTGEGSFDHQSLRGKAPSGVARAAAAHGKPCVVFAGAVSVDGRDMAASGIAAAHALVDSAGSVEAAMARPAAELAALAERVAEVWARRGRG